MDVASTNCGVEMLGVIAPAIGPLQALLAILPGLLLAIGGAVIATLVALFKPSGLRAAGKLLWRLKWFALTLAAVVGGGIAGWAMLGPAKHEAAAAAVLRGDDWPMFRGGPRRPGAAAGAVGPAGGRVLWSRFAGEEWFYSSPAVVGNRVFIASAKLTPFDRKDGEGKIYCLDANSGAVAWAVRPEFAHGAGRYRATFSSPAVKGDLLVCGEGLHYAEGARIVCLSVAHGRMLWHHATTSHVECTPVIAPVRFRDANGQPAQEDRVFVGAGDDGYYCLALKTGQVRWHLSGKDHPDAETALTVHDNRVYAGLGNGGMALCVIDAATGRELRRVATPYPVFAPPAVADGKLYVGMGNGDFVAPGNPPAGELWCLDLAKLNADGNGPVAPDWKAKTSDTILAAVAVAGDEVYFATADGHVGCLDRRSGAELGKWSAHAPIKASPAVAGECVYVITSAGMLYGLSRRELVCTWEFRVGSAPECISSPALAGGRLYVGTQADGVVCIGWAAGQTPPPRKSRTYVWSGRLGGPETAGNCFGSPPPAKGELHWMFPADQDGSSKQAVVAAPPALAGANLLVGVAAGKAAGLVCLPAAAADETPKPLWAIADPLGVHVSPAVAGGTALFVTGKSADANRAVCAAATANGAVAWRRPVAPHASGILTATAHGLYVQDGADTLTALEPDGRRTWCAAVGGRLSGPVAVTENMVVAGAVAGTPVRGLLVALDRPTGTELWRMSLGAAPVTGPYVHRAAIYVGTAAGLEAHSLVDGQPPPGEQWKMQGGGVSGDFAAGRDRFVFVNSSGELVALRRSDGALLAKPLAGAKVGAAPLPAGDAILYEAADGRIMAAKIPDAPAPSAAPKASVWFANEDKWLGEAATPMVLSGTGVYVGRVGWGLVRLGEPK